MALGRKPWEDDRNAWAPPLFSPVSAKAFLGDESPCPAYAWRCSPVTPVTAACLETGSKSSLILPPPPSGPNVLGRDQSRLPEPVDPGLSGPEWGGRGARSKDGRFSLRHHTPHVDPRLLEWKGWLRESDV